MRTRFRQKIVAPSLSPLLITRGSGLAQVDDALHTFQIVALAAPAGWGKTTALAQWAAQHAAPVAWYTLDASDREPLLFLDYLLSAVEPFIPATREILEQLEHCPPSRLPDLFRDAALVIADTPTPFTLVLDDLHELDDTAADLPGTTLARDMLATLAAYAPHCRMVLASRTVPALGGLARLIAQGKAAMLDYTALQWSADDVQTLAVRHYRRELDAETARALVQRVDGWAVGVVLTLGQQLQSPGGQVASPADSLQLSHYFTEQIMNPLPRPLQAFLEDTSVLDDLSATLCDRLRGQHDSRRWLDEILRRSLFVDSRGEWLRYHSLFRDYLRDRLNRDPQRRAVLLRRAAELAQEQEGFEQALTCLLAIPAPEQAIALLRHAVPLLRRRSQQMTLLACLDRLSHLTAIPADLLLEQARTYTDMALWERAEQLVYVVIASGLNETRSEAKILAADISVMQREIKRAKSLLSEIVPDTLPLHLQLRYQITSGRVSVLGGNVAEAMTAFASAHELVADVEQSIHNDPIIAPYIHDNLGWAHMAKGEYQQALLHLHRAESYWQACGDAGRRAMTLNNLGSAAMGCGRYDEARDAFEQGISLARTAHRLRTEMELSYSLAELHLFNGHASQAHELFGYVYRLTEQLDIETNRVDSVAGALWTAVLVRDDSSVRYWQTMISGIDVSKHEEASVRLVLAEHYMQLERGQSTPDWKKIGAIHSTCAHSIHAFDKAALELLILSQQQFQAGHIEQHTWATTEQQLYLLKPEAQQLLLSFHQPTMAAVRQTRDVARQQAGISHITSIQVTVLGTFSCFINASDCPLAPLYRSLLLRLIDAGPGGVAVEQVWEDVWGSDELSMPALHQALRRLRLRTGLDVAAHNGVAALWSGWEQLVYDVRELESLLRAPISDDQIDRIIHLYGGDFFPAAPTSATHWADRRRVQLQSRVLEVLEHAASREIHSRPVRALLLYQRIFEIDTCREHAALELIRLAAKQGNMALALTTFQRLERSLRKLGMRPELETARFVESLHHTLQKRS